MGENRSFTVTFQREKETKTTWRYEEVEVEGEPPKLKSLYVPKWLKPGLTIKVTVELG